MSSILLKTVTAAYIGLSTVAIYFFMHAALSGQPLFSNTTATTGSTTSVAKQTSKTPSESSSGSSTSTPNSSSEPNSSGNLTSQQYDETTNWAGYAATSGTYSSISGSWDIPIVSGSDETAADATWIGIGGVTTNDLIQVGTQNVVSPDGQVSTLAFYELLPDASESITSLNVNPGDTISASLSEVGSGEWRITLDDTTTGQSFSTIASYNSSESSAEWIEEDPSDGTDQQIPFDNFSSVSFSASTATDNDSSVSIAGSGAQEVSMINGEGQPLVSVSSLSASGEGFSVTRTSAASTSSIAQFNNDPGGWIRRGSGMGFGGSFGDDDLGGFGQYQSEGYGF